MKLPRRLLQMRGRVRALSSGIHVGLGPRGAATVLGAAALVVILSASQGARFLSPPPGAASASASLIGEATPTPSFEPSLTAAPPSDAPYSMQTPRYPMLKPAGGQEFYHGDRTRKEIFITVDDCGRWGNIQRDIETAHAKGVTLTLFPAGMYIAAHMTEASDNLRRAVSYGDEIGNHTFHHVRMLSTDVNAMKAELDTQLYYVRQVLGDPTYREWFIRPPYGSGMGNVSFIKAAAKDGLAIANWSIDSLGYWSGSTVAFVLKNIFETRDFSNGAIILLHDDNTDTAALPLIIDGIRERGYTVGGDLRNILMEDQGLQPLY